MQDKEYLEKLIETESRSKSNTKRLDDHDKKLEDIHELTYAVKELANETKLMREDVNKMDSRLNVLEEKPLKEYEKTKAQVIKQVVSFIVGIILMYIAFKLGLDKFI